MTADPREVNEARFEQEEMAAREQMLSEIRSLARRLEELAETVGGLLLA